MSFNAALILNQSSAAYQNISNKSACNVMLASIATGCGVNTNGFLNNHNANQQVAALSSLAADSSSGWEYLGQGDAGAMCAVTRANPGYFVVAGWVNPSGHGHVAVANQGTPVNGWPLGTWGSYQHPENAAYCRSLRETFGSQKRPVTKFFARELP